MNEPEKIHTDKAFNDCWHRIGVWGREQPRCPRLDEVVHCHNCDVYHAASRLVYQRDLPEAYQLDWTTLLATEKKHNEVKKGSIVVFRLGDEWVGLASVHLKEISEIRPIHRLPHNKSKFLRGVVNIGGEIELCFSMGSILGIQKAVQEESRGQIIYNRMVVVDLPSGKFVFPVTEIGGIVHYTDEDLKPVPSTVSAAAGTYMKGVVAWPRGFVGFLDSELLFSALERSLR